MSPKPQSALRRVRFFVDLIGLFVLLQGAPLFAQMTAVSSTNAPSIPATPPANIAPVRSAPPPVKPTAANDPFSDPLIQQVQVRHEKAVNGDEKETKALTADLEKWTQEQPANYLLLAYLGSTYTLDSRDAWPGPGKLTYLRNGGKLLDQAVAAAPNNPAVRFVRAIDYFELPFFFGKRQTARDDFQILVRQTDGEVKTPYTLNVETQQAIDYYAGLSFVQISQYPQAREVWMRGVQLDPTSALAAKMQAELGKLK